MAHVALQNRAKVDRAASRLGAVNLPIGGMPYTLRAGAANSDEYYHAISAFADEWLLHARDGVGDLVEAAAGLDAELLLVGDGSDRARLESRARELGVKATFTGFVDHDEVPRHYAAADIVCHPSLYEPLGNVVLEAMASGKPIVAARSGGLGEVFEPGTGALVEPGDVEGIREALRGLVEDEGARRRAGEVGLATAPRYGWDRVAEATVAICGEIIERRG